MAITSFEFTDKFRDWKLTKTDFSSFNLLTRNGSEISVLDQNEITALDIVSSQEQFILLMNLKEYEEGYLSKRNAP